MSGKSTNTFSDFMHPRNPYRRYDYETLAKCSLEFKSYLKEAVSKDPGKPTKFFLDWTDREAVRCLMKCCLRRDFQLDLDLPDGCLAPSLALKMNYLLWLEDTLNINQIKDVTGLDIGTGGGIYFCAIAAKHFGWKMVGTEANKDDFEIAQTNVSKNHLDSTIKVIHTEDETEIFPKAIFDGRPGITFSVCNPPFFEASEPRQDRNVFDEKDAGRDHEMVVEGGEVAFISRMIDESVALQDKIKIFSTLVGLKKNLGKLIRKLSSLKSVKRWIVNQFCQGKSMRWCLSWTFLDSIHLKPSQPVSEARHNKKMFTPIRFILEKLDGKESLDLTEVYSSTMKILCSIQLEVMQEEKSANTITIEFRSFEPSWRGQRAQRRKEKQGPQIDEVPAAKRAKIDSNETSDKPQDVAIVGKISIIKLETGQFAFDIVYVDGNLGKNGIAELSQFFKSRLNFVQSKQERNSLNVD